MGTHLGPAAQAAEESGECRRWRRRSARAVPAPPALALRPRPSGFTNRPPASRTPSGSGLKRRQSQSGRRGLPRPRRGGSAGGRALALLSAIECACGQQVRRDRVAAPRRRSLGTGRGLVWPWNHGRHGSNPHRGASGRGRDPHHRPGVDAWRGCAKSRCRSRRARSGRRGLCGGEGLALGRARCRAACRHPPCCRWVLRSGCAAAGLLSADGERGWLCSLAVPADTAGGGSGAPCRAAPSGKALGIK